MHADILIHSAAQLVTCASPTGPKRGAAMRDVGVIDDGAVAIRDNRLVAIGRSDILRLSFDASQEIDATNKVICPGFIDPHTHLVYAGDRVNEWEMKLNGAAYLEILAAGGGIVSTMRATRAAAQDTLVDAARARLDVMFRHGVTTCEIKTGYGLDIEVELKMLRVIEQLAQTHPCDVLPTLLAAHTVPPEFKGNPEGYVDLVCDQIIPQTASWFKDSGFGRPPLTLPSPPEGEGSEPPSLLGRGRGRGHPSQPNLFIDVFCEQSAFTVEQSRRVLLAGKQHGMLPKIHVDQFNALGGVAMALEVGAISCDHLDVTTPADRALLAKSNAVATVLPAVTFHLGGAHFAHARAMIDDGCALALSTDHNPGSAPCLSPQLVMAIACRYLRLSSAEALNAVTINAAHALGLGHKVGSLEVGKQADLLIVDAPDYRHLAYQFGGNLVERIIKNGTGI